MLYLSYVPIWKLKLPKLSWQLAYVKKMHIFASSEGFSRDSLCWSQSKFYFFFFMHLFLMFTKNIGLFVKMNTLGAPYSDGSMNGQTVMRLTVMRLTWVFLSTKYTLSCLPKVNTFFETSVWESCFACNKTDRNFLVWGNCWIVISEFFAMSFLRNATNRSLRCHSIWSTKPASFPTALL